MLQRKSENETERSSAIGRVYKVIERGKESDGDVNTKDMLAKANE